MYIPANAYKYIHIIFYSKKYVDLAPFLTYRLPHVSSSGVIADDLLHRNHRQLYEKNYN